MANRNALRQLLRPKSVAVIGGRSAAEVVRQCVGVGFHGDIWAVNPQRSELAGIPCVASVSELPAVPDASFIAAPPTATLDVVRELSALGAPGAVCFAAGFAETGETGRALQQQLRDAAGDMAVMGPNCHGFLNYLDGVALWPDQHGGRRTDSGVALISQSGNIAINLTMQQRGLDYAYVISVGNNSALGVHDYIETLLDDERISAIGLHIEGLNDVSAFSRAAIRALREGVPIIALKAGRSVRGADITLSHTGSLAGSDQLYSALFARLGIARCDTVSQFLESLKFVSIVGTLPTATIGSMSCSGGDASIVADNAEALQLDMPALSDASIARLQPLLGPNVRVANPLDYHLYIWGYLDKLTVCFTEILRNEFGCTLLVLDYPAGDNNDDSHWRTTEQALVAAVAATGQRAVVVSSLPETMVAVARERLKAAGIAPMQGIEDCLFAIRAAAMVGQKQRGAADVLPVGQPGVMAGKAVVLDEWQSKQTLAAAGVPIPVGKICSAESAAHTANQLGFPVALKAVSSELVHKSDVGAVSVGLLDETAVLTASYRMSGLSERFLVEKMIGPPVAELIVGINRDGVFGLTMLIGSGGTLVELLNDTVSLLLPVQRQDVAQAIDSLKVSALIDGYRGGSGGNCDAVIDAILAIAEYAETETESLLELDVNPLLVTPTAAIAVDAHIRKTNVDGAACYVAG